MRYVILDMKECFSNIHSGLHKGNLTNEFVIVWLQNFAREFMQLFTIGLYELHVDGTPKHRNGTNIRTYSNKDIMEYARVWTGFEGQPLRGNAAAKTNRVDPMNINPKWRDPLPKMGVRGEYIGHGYPLCVDLPPQHFLKRGAKYRLLGYNNLPELQEDPRQWLDRTDIVFFEAYPNVTSHNSLYSKLCGAKLPSYPNSPCRYPAVVTLTENIPCHGSLECTVNSIRTVKVGDVFYEYVQPPCVQHAFYDNARKIKKRDWFEYKRMYMCADPRTEVATAGCCSNHTDTDYMVYSDALFWGERVQWWQAQARCHSFSRINVTKDFGLCTSTGYLEWANIWAYGVPFFWFGNVPCHVQAKLHVDGTVAIVHTVPDEDPAFERRKLVTDHDTKVSEESILLAAAAASWPYSYP